MSKRSTLPLLVLILLLAALARMVNITQQSLWLDEGFTYHVIRQPDMFPALLANTSPPLYFLLLRGWTALVGDSVLAMRFFSALPSLLSVAVIYRLAKDLGRDRPRAAEVGVAALAMLLLALSDADIFLAQEVRMYGWRKLLVCLSAWTYLRWARQPGGGRAFWWVLSTAALPCTHYLGVYLPLVEGLHALIFLRGRTRRGAIGLLALSGALFLPWFLGVTLDQAATPPPWEMLNAPPSNLETLADLRDNYLTGQWGLMLVLALWGLVVLRCEAAEQGGSAQALETRGLSPLPIQISAGSTFFLAAWLVLSVALTFLGNLWIPLLMPRNLALITPAIAILVARGLGNLRNPARGLLIAAIVVYGVTTVDFYRVKPPWDQVGADAARYAVPGEVALMEVGNGGYPLGYYLDHGMPAGTPVRSLPLWREGARDAYPGELAALLEGHPTVWLAAWGDDLSIFAQLADRGYTRTATMTTDHLGNALNVHRYDLLPVREDPVAAFTSGMMLRRVAIHPEIARVDLWWSAEATPDRDYTVSAFLLDASGRLAAQYDSYPFENARPTTAWLPGEVVYDPHPLDVIGVPPGTYTVGVKVYTWQDGAVYATVAGDEYAVVGTVMLPTPE